AHLPCIAQCLRTWAGRRELSGLPARPREHLSTRGHEPRFLDVGLLAQTNKRGGSLAPWGLGEIERHYMGLEKQFVPQGVARRPAEIEPPFKRALDAHVEPRLNALREALQRHGIDEQPGEPPHTR